MNEIGLAREETLRVLQLVRQGMPVADALGQRSASQVLTSADRALMTQMAYGVLRHRRYLDAWVEPYVRGPLEDDVRDILRMALFQLHFLDRVPQYAIVNSAVEQVKRVNPRAAGLMNALLHRCIEHPPAENLPPAVEFSHPDWLVERWQQRFGGR
ncbi:MAG: 16S rRNA (cytosine(967)-C(5))-methyltransferase RsmB, partial [Firmicutes bacterium]|nr:16S rRNA (cytosine(967)-C(5))-methyltransferase RsmB [Bacillota bacterium]